MQKFKGNIPSIVLFLIPVLLYGILLSIHIPYSFTQIFRTYTFIPFLVVLLLYYGCFRLPGRYAWLAGFALTMILCALTLSYKWSSGYSDNGVIGGLIPYKDGKNYYVGAQTILNGSFIPADGLQAAWRPLSPGLLASILFLTRQNLQLSLAILAGLTGLCSFLAAYGVLDRFGSFPSALFMTLLYFWIQPFIGYNLSEIPGFFFGCLGFLLLWKAASSGRVRDLVLGLVLLVIAVSARAGAFFIFPLLIIWAGWAWRAERRFSYRMAGITLATVSTAILFVNVIYPRLVVVSEGVAQGNFAYAIYGQVRGGTGWHQAIEDLNTNNPSVVYRAAWQFFRAHPFSLFIGILKSYRDFFLPHNQGIFPFTPYTGPRWFDTLLWLVMLFLVFFGLYYALKRERSAHSALLAAGLIGISLSIPFLPPVDGGSRFYAGTMAFFMAIPAYAVSTMFKEKRQAATGLTFEKPVQALGILLILLTIALPPALRGLRSVPAVAAPACENGQLPFVIERHPGSYINLVPKGVRACGPLPDVCYSDFIRNGAEKNIDDFFQAIMSIHESSPGITRLFPAVNIIDNEFHYFIAPEERFEASGSDRWIAGCATHIRTDNQTIYFVEPSRPLDTP